MPSYLQAPVVAVNNLASNFYEIICRPDQSLNFHPGQYIITKIHDTRVSQYSISSRPDQSTFSLLVDVSPGGDSSKYFQSLQVGDFLQYLPPMGQFIFHHDSSTHFLFLATGSGIAPLLSMIETNLSSLPANIHLLFGLRHDKDIFYLDRLNQISQSNPNFTYQISLSDPSSNWSGLTGYITTHISTLKFPWPKTSVYLCGSPAMIYDSEKIFQKLQVPQAQIYTEKYWLP